GLILVVRGCRRFAEAAGCGSRQGGAAMRHPVRSQLSRVVLELLRGPATDDRRVLGQAFTDAQLSELDRVAAGFTAPPAHDELAQRRRARDQALARAWRTGTGGAAT